MLTAPNDNNRPLFAAKDIKGFYLDNCPDIFPQPKLFGGVTKVIKVLTGPKYDGKYLHGLVRQNLGNRKLHDTLTSVVIPAFDIKRLQPTIFSTYEAKKQPSLDALLSDICIATSAAPTYLPAHYFKTEDVNGKATEFNLIDGGVAANNPTLVAIGEVTKEIIRGNPDFFAMKTMEYGRLLVISLGTGTSKDAGKYTADEAAKWGVLGWLTIGGSTPLVDIFTQASGDMVDLHLFTVLRALNSEQNYLRIQDDTLSGEISSVDVATKENLEALVRVGEGLLNKPVSRVNLNNGIYEPVNGETNQDALIRFANRLSQERRLRHTRSPIGQANGRYGSDPKINTSNL